MFDTSSDFIQTLPTVTRLEVIDHRYDSTANGSGGRVFGAHRCAITVSVQDDGRTLKVFVDDRKTAGDTTQTAEFK